MKIQEVNAKKFDALHKKRIDLRACPVCSQFTGEVIIPFRAYGNHAKCAYIKCVNCGYETGKHSTVSAYHDAETKRYGTFTIERSLMRAVYSAIAEWNGATGGAK